MLRLSIGQAIYFLLYVVFVDCIFCGIVVATVFWFASNRYMRIESGLGDVEWGYAFDVHLNAFYPPLIILHFVQLFFYNAIINHDWFMSRFLGNTLWLLAISYYIYITFLGYHSKCKTDQMTSKYKIFFNSFLYNYFFRCDTSKEYTTNISCDAISILFLCNNTYHWMEFKCDSYEFLSLSSVVNSNFFSMLRAYLFL